MAKLTTEMFAKYLQSKTNTFERVLNKVKLISCENGNLLAELKIEEEHTNPIGTLHGGLSATLVDSLSSIALSTHKHLTMDTPHVSVDIHTTYLKGAQIGETIEIDAKTLRAGRSLAYLDVVIRNKETKDILVKGSHTKYILPVTSNTKLL